MSIGSDGHWPFGRIVVPDGTMVVEEVGQMVWYQVLSGRSHVQWVPEMELLSHLLNSFSLRLQVGWQRCIREEDVIPELVSDLLRLEIGNALLLPINIALQVVDDGVIGHVDGGVRE